MSRSYLIRTTETTDDVQRKRDDDGLREANGRSDGDKSGNKCDTTPSVLLSKVPTGPSERRKELLYNVRLPSSPPPSHSLLSCSKIPLGKHEAPPPKREERTTIWAVSLSLSLPYPRRLPTCELRMSFPPPICCYSICLPLWGALLSWRNARYWGEISLSLGIYVLFSRGNACEANEQDGSVVSRGNHARFRRPFRIITKLNNEFGKFEE